MTRANPSPSAASTTQHVSSPAVAHPIVFFDGVCGMCNASVNALLSRDPDGRLRFAPLQGETAQALLPQKVLASLDTLVLARNDRFWVRSAAVVRILWTLGGVWRLYGALLWLIPLPLRDLGYRAIAALRYRIAGKHDACRLPTPEERARFLP